MAFVLALDQGTTSSRAILFDGAGQPVASAQREFPQLFPRPGWVEHDPSAIWESQETAAREAMNKAGVPPREIAGIGITNQRETTLVWDRRTGTPVHNAIVWQDRRTARQCSRLLEEGLEPGIREKTGLLLDPYFSATKISWILENVPGARQRAEAGELAFGTVDSWLVWNLTGGRLHVTDVTNASRTLLFNIRTGDWDGELLDIFGVPRAMLPEVRDSSGIVGESSVSGLGAGLPVAAIAGDQQAALFGQACQEPGMVKNTYGTGCFLVMNTGNAPRDSSNRLLTSPAWRIGGRTGYALEGSVFVAGAAVQWLRDGLGLIRSASEIEALAASVPDSGGVFFVPAFAGLGAPHWDPVARGTIVGLTRGTTAAHIARAALESIAFQSSDVADAIAEDAGLELSEFRVDGGAAVNSLLMQFQADLLGVPVVRPRVTETTALGAAFLAGLALGVWKDQREIATHWEAERVFEPKRSRGEVAEARALWRRALDRSREWLPIEKD